ncbi:MAG TPA: hypothetical protein VEG31_00700, partial [Thermoproteota archaeon]|nr:hypothetical protein [Thermoproteota archaeon]
MIARKSLSLKRVIFLLTQCLRYLSCCGLACFEPLRNSASALLSISSVQALRVDIKERPRVQIRTATPVMDSCLCHSGS